MDLEGIPTDWKRTMNLIYYKVSVFDKLSPCSLTFYAKEMKNPWTFELKESKA